MTAQERLQRDLAEMEFFYWYSSLKPGWFFWSRVSHVS
jgi:hypothetical protein